MAVRIIPARQPETMGTSALKPKLRVETMKDGSWQAFSLTKRSAEPEQRSANSFSP